MRSSEPFLLRYCGRVFSRLNPLKPCQNQARLRPDGNKPRMPDDTDLAMVIAHGCKLQSSHARFTAVALVQSAPVERDSICFSPLSGAKGIPSDLPNCRKVRQVHSNAWPSNPRREERQA